MERWSLLLLLLLLKRSIWSEILATMCSHVCVSQSVVLLIITNKHIMIAPVPDLSTFQCVRIKQ